MFLACTLPAKTARVNNKPTGSRLTREWTPPDDLQAWATDARPDLSVTEQIERFRDYWCAIPGAKGRKTDWPATWRNWIRGQHAKPGTFAAQTIDYDRVARMANLTDNEERTHAPE